MDYRKVLEKNGLLFSGVSPDGTLLLAGMEYGGLSAWDAATGSVQMSESFGEPITSAAWYSVSRATPAVELLTIPARSTVTTTSHAWSMVEWR